MIQRLSRALAVLVVMAAASACGESPTAPTPERTTETFTGTVAQAGFATHPFTVRQVGQVDLTLVTVAPLNTVAIGFAVGSWDGANCSLIAGDDNARQGYVLSGTAQPGTFCVAVYDSGNIGADPVEYTVTVVHP